MKTPQLGATINQKLCAEALNSAAVNHPYLRSFEQGNLPNIELAIQDFAFQYGWYSSRFTRYVTAVTDNLQEEKHKEILRHNLEEELGDTHDVDLPTDVLESIADQPHTALFRRFQAAVGVNADYRKNATTFQPGKAWSEEFLRLCQTNQWVGVGALGVGTEYIVSAIYKQILEGLKTHSQLDLKERVFFDLHSECDDEHAAQLLLIAEDLTANEKARTQIEYGAKQALQLRVDFWDAMLTRAQGFPASTFANTEKLSALGN